MVLVTVVIVFTDMMYKLIFIRLSSVHFRV